MTIKRLLLLGDAARHAAFSCGISFVPDGKKKLAVIIETLDVPRIKDGFQLLAN